MNNIKSFLFISTALLLSSCATSASSSEVVVSSESQDTTSSIDATSEESSQSDAIELPDFNVLKATYGAFSIIGETADANYSYDDANKIYTINVNASEKLQYTLSGFFQGKIVIQNGDNLSSFKGVTLTLNNACLTNLAGRSSVIEYALESKNVEIKAKKDTINKIFATDTALAISSANNIEFSGTGTLDLASYGADMHTVKSEGDIAIYGSHTLNVLYSAHDAFHGKHLSYINDSSLAYTGHVNISQAVSQAFDFETSKGKGSISVEGGTITVENCASVFKTDASLTIGQAAVITAMNLFEEPVAIGENSSGLTYTNNGTFTVDGVPYQHSN